MDNNNGDSGRSTSTCPNDDHTGDRPREGKDLQGEIEMINEQSSSDEDEDGSCSKCKGTSIFDLPRQVWLEIYENLDYATYLNMRQTCWHFLNLIDHYIGLRATFNKNASSNQEIFEFFTKVALNDVQFEEAKEKGTFSYEKLLAYPSFLTDVSFTGATNLDLVKDIVMNCKCLQLVEMTMDCKIIRDDVLDVSDVDDELVRGLGDRNILPGIDIGSPYPPKVSYLNFVECLKLVPGIHSDDNLRSHLILSILRGTKAEDYLKKVIFQCELSDKITLRNVLTITAEVMEKHPNLEALFLALLNDEYLLDDGEVQEYSSYMDLATNDDGHEINAFKKRIVATGHYLKIKKMGLAMLNLSMQNIWGDFLRTQHHLVHLSLTVTIRQGTFSQEMFDSFSGSLEQLAIRGKFEEPFDFLHVTNCRNLKEICLHNLQDNGGGGIIPKCVNLPHAPDDLESLILFQVVTRTEELKEAVRKLDKLTTLVVFKCGHAAGETGVGLRCLQEVLHKRSLQSILMVQFICGSTQEAESLAGVLYDMAQDLDNQASPLARRRTRRRHLQQAVPANDPENLLDLREVEDGGDELLFAIGGNAGSADHAHIGREHEERPRSSTPPLQRPVSRGSHRDPNEVGEATILESGDDDDPSSPPGGSPPGNLELEQESNVQSSTLPKDQDLVQGEVEVERVVIEEVSSSSTPREFALTSVEFPPLPEPEPEDVQNNNCIIDNGVGGGDLSMNHQGPLENGSSEGEIANIADSDDDDYPEIVMEVRDENNNAAFNMLQNILEQAMAGDPAQVRRNPNLQNHMNLDRLQQEFDEDVELILDVGDQELGPVLDLFAAERLAREHNVQVGFILDGVIDIMNEDEVRSKWLCMEDSDGHITYTLKISVEL